MASDVMVDSAARVREVIGRLNRHLRRTRAGAAFSPTEGLVLVSLVRSGPLRISELAALEGLNPTMLSRVTAKLEAAAMVARLTDPLDGRACVVQATSSGKRWVERVRSEREDALRTELDALSADESRLLLNALPVLEHIAESLKDRQP